MNAGTSSANLVHLAYCLLKQETYYGKMGLFSHANVAAFQTNDFVTIMALPLDTQNAIDAQREDLIANIEKQRRSMRTLFCIR